MLRRGFQPSRLDAALMAMTSPASGVWILLFDDLSSVIFRQPTLTFNCLKSEVVWLISQYQNRRKKPDPKTVVSIFIGYAHSNINRFLMINSEISEISNNTIIEVRDVVYFENIFPFKYRIPSDLSFTPSASDISSFSSAPTIDFEPRRSKRIRTLTFFGEDFYTYLVEGDPNSFKEAMNSFKFFSGKKSLTVRSNP